jgi:uncharacterized protein YcfJ
MKKYLGLSLFFAAAACASPASAQSTWATVTSVSPNWVDTIKNVPVEQCSIQRVPVYGRVKGKGASGLEILGGALFGGLLGKAVTEKDEGAAIGGILGGVVAAEAGRADKIEVVGYENKNICYTINKDFVESEIISYKIEYEWNGFYGQTTTSSAFVPGDEIEVRVSLVPKQPL